MGKGFQMTLGVKIDQIDRNLPFYLLDSDPFWDFGNLELRSDDKDSLLETVSRGTGKRFDIIGPEWLWLGSCCLMVKSWQTFDNLWRFSIRVINSFRSFISSSNDGDVLFENWKFILLNFWILDIWLRSCLGRLIFIPFKIE